MSEPVSPCTNLCQLDRARRFCRGCGRTASEIGRWSTAGEEEKQAILAKLPSRLAALQPKRKKGSRAKSRRS
ncbi:MAG: DUF1289 domain-containing protein [Croceibacterium sp.]